MCGRKRENELERRKEAMKSICLRSSKKLVFI